MKRDREVQISLLRKVRDGLDDPRLEQLAADVVSYNAALLIEEGLVEGRAIRNHQGVYTGAALTNLTNEGHNLLESLDAKSQSTPNTPNTMKVFISHASTDTNVAAALVELLRAAFPLPRTDIRCTSVDGYRLPAGSDTDEQLRQEVRAASAFIGVITPHSITSTYVLFELGARWGADLPLFPVLSGGAHPGDLRGPLGGINALDMTSDAQIHQLLSDLAPVISLALDSAGGYLDKIRSLMAIAAVSAPEVQEDAPQVAQSEVLSDDEEKVLEVFASANSWIPNSDVCRAIGFTGLKVDYLINRLLEGNYLQPQMMYVAGEEITHHIDQKGRSYVFEKGLVQ